MIYLTSLNHTVQQKQKRKRRKRKNIHVRFQKEGAEYTFELFVFRHRSNLAHNAVLSFITTWLEAAIPTHSNPHHSSVSFIILPNKLLNRPGVVTNASQPNTKKQICKNKFIWGVNKCKTQTRKARNENLLWRLNGKQFVMAVPWGGKRVENENPTQLYNKPFSLSL